MKKVRLIDVFNMYNTLMKLSEKILPLKITYWIIKNTSNLKDGYVMYLDKRNQIWKELLYENPDGTIIHKNNNGLYEYNCIEQNRKEFMSRMNELDNFEIEYTPYILDLDELIKTNPDISLESKFILELSDLITYK